MNNLVSRIWSRLENHPWLTMTVAVLAQTWFTIGNRALWFSDEVRYANAYQNMVEGGKWVVLALNGQVYPDKPPVYFWFLWLLDTLTPFDAPQVFFLGAALSGLFFLFAAYVLSRSLKFDKTVSLASSLILLSTFLLVALFHYSRMDLMFAALILLSHACLYRAVTEDRQGRWPLWGLLLAGVATLVKGPLGFIFPLLTTVLYLLLKGEIRKFFSRQFALGLLAMLGILAAWIVGVIWAEGADFLLKTVLGQQIIQRATHTFHHKEAFYWYLVAFPLAWMPWTLAIFVTPVKKLFSIGHWATLRGQRHQAGPKAFLWIMFVGIFVFLSSLSGKVLIYILPMFPPLAILTALAMQSLDEAHGRRLWALVGGLWVIAGAGLLLVGDLLPVPVPIRGMGISAGILLLGGTILFAIRASGYRTALLTIVLAMVVWLYPVGLIVAPSLDNAMSPKRQGLILRDYIEQGYTPFAGKIYSGIYTYYAGQNLHETDNLQELTEGLKTEKKAVLVIRAPYWNDIRDNLPEFRIIDRQSIAGMTYLIAIKG